MLSVLAVGGLALPAGAAAKTYAPGLAADSSGGSVMDRYHHLGSRVLRPGDRGHDVRVAQDLLRRVGQKVKIDGSYGPSTVKAVKAWEKAGTRHVDGVLTQADDAVLRAAAEAPAPVAPLTETPGEKATLNADGTATAPASAPQAVKDIIAAGNQIATKPYRYGGGHGAFTASAGGYDCSGSVSYALHGASLLGAPRASGEFVSYGASGPGQWVTIYANSGHMYMTVAGLRFDTSGAHPSRWQTSPRPPSGYTVRHPAAL